MGRSGKGDATLKVVPSMRTCVGCRERDARSNLVRLVVVDGRVVVDPKASMPGRGAWLHPRSACLDNACRRRACDRALRGRFTLDDVAGQMAATMTGPTNGHDPERGLEADGHPMSTQR